MRGNLAVREPEMLAQWEQNQLYQTIRSRKTSAHYILHDGPPYANGHIHYGHILNKLIKDIVIKYRTMCGDDAPYVPGWDCHGLPIERAVDRQLGDKKKHLSKSEIRAHCRKYALDFIETQKTEFRRLGIFADWETPYRTLDPSYEASVIRALAAFVDKGYIYRGKKPIAWCPKDKTALAEAEIEHHTHQSPSIYVGFVLDNFDATILSEQLKNKTVILPIWTTTPWTLPANLAITLHPDIPYVAISKDDSTVYLVAQDLQDAFCEAIGQGDQTHTSIAITRECLHKLEGQHYLHPFVEPKDDTAFTVRFGRHVTTAQGTGLVHTAPGHGIDDYKLGLAHGLEPYAPIDEECRFTADVPWWEGKFALDTNTDIIAKLHSLGALLNPPDQSVTHSYPHCWRCKCPILFRATSQWFLSIDHLDLRQRALTAIDNTEWIPPEGHARISSMVQNRPDWCLSRQRTWGVPIPTFYCNDCGHAHADATIMEHVAKQIEQEGSDIWYTKDIQEILPSGTACEKCKSTEIRLEQDIIDVWFESGVSWSAIDTQHGLNPIDLYIEGSDQHRGWFHSSLLTSVAIKEKAPYNTVVTHGFVLDEKGHPYSKSNIEKSQKEGGKIRYTAPEQIIDKYGAELFRIWTAATEFRGDVPYSDTLLTNLATWYRKFRNTARFILGNLSDYDPKQPLIPQDKLIPIDRYALAQSRDFVWQARQAYDAFAFHKVYLLLVDYLTHSLSNFYLDIVKDRLYVNNLLDPKRKSVQQVLYEILRNLVQVSAPILAFTSEDVWQHLPNNDQDPSSIHLTTFPQGEVMDDDLNKTWTILGNYRSIATKELEAFRAQNHRSLDAKILITPHPSDRSVLEKHLDHLAELFIVSQVSLAQNNDEKPYCTISKADGILCQRCWKHTISIDPQDELCKQCQNTLTNQQNTIAS